MVLMGSTITKGDVLRYMFTPQILPRLHSFTQGGFGILALLVALVFRAVDILPAHHPVLKAKPEDITIRMVIALAAQELRYEWKYIDRIVIFFLIILGLVLLFLQFFVLLGYLMLNPAFAQGMPTTYTGFFSTPQPQTDIAYGMLYNVFGLPELFRPGAELRNFHKALGSLFQLYSTGLLVVAVIVICYFIFAIVAETAETGVPFGRRYNHVWTPIRLVVALGLLIPVGYGYNGAQWITLYAAKFGSDFATSGWILFNDTMKVAYLNQKEARVGIPNSPEFKELIAFMSVAMACQDLYEAQGHDIRPYMITGKPKNLTDTIVTFITGFFGSGEASSLGKVWNYLDLLSGKQLEDVLVRFGEHSKDKYPSEKGNVYPYCGDLILLMSGSQEKGAMTIQKGYVSLIWNLYTGGGTIGWLVAKDYDLREMSNNFVMNYIDPESNFPLPAPDYKSVTVLKIQSNFKNKVLNTAIEEFQESANWEKMKEEIPAYGWGGAGLWYNKIAQINGALVSSVFAVPQVRRMPAVMEYMREKQMQQDQSVSEPFKPTLSDGKEMAFSSTTDQKIGGALSKLYYYWGGSRGADDIRTDDLGNQTRSTGNAFIEVVNLLFGTSGLFSMCSNADVHPLAQLSILGRGFIETSIRNFSFGTITWFVSMFAPGAIGAVASALSSIFLSMISITLALGFVLYYILPFLPFLYFFFAVGGWVKGIFEAMVGVPLWALAHLRIDGEGLPGSAALGGYYLIFEVFLRPILIIFGLLASLIIFESMVKVLHEIFAIVVMNLSGHDPSQTVVCGAIPAAGSVSAGSAPPAAASAMSYFRGPVDEFFFTVIYVIIVFLIGLSCFKLIDLIPNNILRFMGNGVSSFGDQAGDPAGNLLTYAGLGGQRIAQSAEGAYRAGLKGTENTTFGFVKDRAKKKKIEETAGKLRGMGYSSQTSEEISVALVNTYKAQDVDRIIDTTRKFNQNKPNGPLGT